ncbi:unnamed protein product, partial [Mesorhabditis belari]|uniref:PID domain-containing protein n=1 Tax=Mesorhabditis belari TaxID=2138241 RepID=A0AAF3E9T6_9BILA
MVVPLCRCRVLYIGSAVPIVTKDGLQGIQQPLRERYPVEEVTDTKGIDSWLSVWSNGILLEYIEGEQKSETAFFPINTLHYCAAVRYVNVTGYAIEGGGEKFLPLDSPFANLPDSPHPPIFAAIFRRTTGVKVLECHGFICTNNRAANALVRCCFHAYADSIYLKIDDKIPGLKAIKGGEDERGLSSPQPPPRSPSPPNLDDPEELDGRKLTTLAGWERRQQNGDYDSVSMSSTLGRTPMAKKAASESGTAARHAIVPYGAHRRAGSETDLYGPVSPAMARMGPPPPPHMRGFPPHPFMPPFFPPPFMMPGMKPPPPPPPHLRHPPPFMPPFGARLPPPPPFRGFPPHPFLQNPFFPPPPPHFFHSYRPQSPIAEAGTGPIITSADSMYGTIPRGRAFEEPAYVSEMSGIPEASYAPHGYRQHYESMDTLRRGAPRKGPGSSAASVRGETSSAAAWDAYEAGIYRRPHLNEKAFSGTLRSERERESQTIESEIRETRPDTPPVDYEAFEGLHISEKSKNNAHQRSAVY